MVEFPSPLPALPFPLLKFSGAIVVDVESDAADDEEEGAPEEEEEDVVLLFAGDGVVVDSPPLELDAVEEFVIVKLAPTVGIAGVDLSTVLLELSEVPFFVAFPVAPGESFKSFD